MPYSRSIMGSSGTADSASVASPMKMFDYMAAGPFDEARQIFYACINAHVRLPSRCYV
jgi:hypothetical protein